MSALISTAAPTVASAEETAPWIRQLEFGGESWQGDLKLEPATGPDGGQAVAWTIQASRAESAKLDLREQGIDLNDYDELAVDLYLEGSASFPIFTIREWPRPKTLSNWYAKMRRPLELPDSSNLRVSEQDAMHLPFQHRQGAPIAPCISIIAL